MSINRFRYIPDRTPENWQRFEPGDKAIPYRQHQVLLCHGLHNEVDEYGNEEELFLFNSSDDARWFFDEGYSYAFYEDETEPDHMDLIFDGEVVATKRFEDFRGQVTISVEWPTRTARTEQRRG
jgi:hypothetical protein